MFINYQACGHTKTVKLLARICFALTTNVLKMKELSLPEKRKIKLHEVMLIYFYQLSFNFCVINYLKVRRKGFLLRKVKRIDFYFFNRSRNKHWLKHIKTSPEIDLLV